MAKYKPPLVIIAPKGADYSSIDDEQFGYYQARPIFRELTFEEYCNWVHIKSSVIGISKRERLIGSADQIANDRYDIELILSRYESKFSISDPPDPPFEDKLLDFEGFYPGWLNASKPDPSWFSISYEDFMTSRVENSESFTVANQTSFVYSTLLSEIKPFYHRDKFYIVWDYTPPPLSYRSYSYEVEATKLAIKTEIYTFSGDILAEEERSYELIV